MMSPGIEDVNNELYGGLYSQMIYGESFEEPADESGVSGAHFWEHLPDGQQGVWSRDLLRPTWSRVGCGGSYNVSSESLHGKPGSCFFGARDLLADGNAGNGISWIYICQG
ncbi:unnamed protein product [Cladocopium goreaui]|uniref:Non-reducing end alpha-L-arabinofuranosidase n=1 Tax=Cladocopium goreaui TaxID=2562237 RepID=A0A9P1FST9_9DINO|nr:unnamed protein product [Cladocopium goreaui]